jgi:hypothetical protein
MTPSSEICSMILSLRILISYQLSAPGNRSDGSRSCLTRSAASSVAGKKLAGQNWRWIVEGLPRHLTRIRNRPDRERNGAFTIPIWKYCTFRCKLLCVKTEAFTSATRWHVLLCALFCLLAILPYGYAQSITELKSEAEDGDVQAQLALAKAYQRRSALEAFIPWERVFQKTTPQPCAGGRRPPSKAM